MLLELNISNFILIEKTRIEFSPGFNVLSGETGAGKSILLEALAIVLGHKFSAEHARLKDQPIRIEAIFDHSKLSQATRQELPQMALDIIEQGESEFILSRELSPEGIKRSRSYLNGRSISSAALKQLSQSLLSVCRQNYFMRLFEARCHVELLDQYCGNQAVLKEYQSAYTQWRQKQDELLQLTRELEMAGERACQLNFLIDQLQDIGLSDNLREDLEAQIEGLSNRERILELAQSLRATIDDSGGLEQIIQDTKSKLHELSKLDANFSSVGEIADSISCQATELSAQLNFAASKVEDGDEKLLDSLREQLSKLASLERRFRTDSSGLKKILDDAQLELEQLPNTDSKTALEAECNKLLESVMLTGEKLRKARNSKAAKLSKQVVKELAELNMQGVNFEVATTPCDPKATGIDQIEFLISTNPASELKAIRSVASGGELSRLTLVLKKILKDSSGANVLVFDEVDSGVSGKVARAMGEKLRELSECAQVICISHLAQVASFADCHLLVEKSGKSSMKTQILRLDANQRIDEVARMLAGYKITEAARRSAIELLGERG